MGSYAPGVPIDSAPCLMISMRFCAVRINAAGTPAHIAGQTKRSNRLANREVLTVSPQHLDEAPPLPGSKPSQRTDSAQMVMHQRGQPIEAFVHVSDADRQPSVSLRRDAVLAYKFPDPIGIKS